MNESKYGQVLRFVATPENQETIQELKRRTGARTLAEVIRRSLYEALRIERLKDGDPAQGAKAGA